MSPAIAFGRREVRRIRYSAVCFCGAGKILGRPFCQSCFGRLSLAAQEALHSGTGEAYAHALGELGFAAPSRPGRYLARPSRAAALSWIKD